MTGLLLLLTFLQDLEALKLGLREAPAIEQAPIKPRHFVVVWSAAWCGPCQYFKRSANYRSIEETYDLRELDVDSRELTQIEKQWRQDVTLVPAVWLCEQLEGGEPVVKKKWLGQVTLKTIQAAERE